MTYIRPASPRDIPLVGERMRLRDVAEVKASSGLDPCEALRTSLEGSSHAWTVTDFGDPVAVFGVAPLAPGMGAPWMLATDAFRSIVRYILAKTPAYIERMHEVYPVLMNYVDVRNKDSIPYLRRAGFSFTGFDPEYGVERRPFLQFTRYRHV